MFLSILFASPVQTTSVISHLIPDMYKAHQELPATSSFAAIASLLHFLATAYPSQNRYFEHLATVPTALLRPDALRWLKDLTRSLRQQNFARLEQLTSRSAVIKALPEEARPRPSSETSTTGAPSNLALEALCTLLDVLRSRARDTTWAILRSAYRELSCPKPTGDAVLSTREWLLRSLALRNVGFIKDGSDDETLLDLWMQQRVTLGDLRAKEGIEGRWIVCKVKA